MVNVLAVNPNSSLCPPETGGRKLLRHFRPGMAGNIGKNGNIGVLNANPRAGVTVRWVICRCQSGVFGGIRQMSVNCGLFLKANPLATL